MEKRKVIVIGTGYVGLPAALMLARAGFQVVGVDINENLVRAINQRVLLIAEEELGRLMADPEVQANLTASTQPEPGDVYLIAVPTPVHPRKKVADLDAVIGAIESICPCLRPGALVIVESTVPPLTCREIIAPLIESRTGLTVPAEVLVAHCPERILPGNIFDEIIHNDRVVGGMDAASAEAARSVYATFVQGELLVTDDVTAELCKLMENAYRDVNIAMANQMADVADALGVDWREAFALANRHPRVSYLMPGIGVGGHCIPIDPWFIKEVDPSNTTLIEVARRINDGRPAQIAAKVRRAVAGVVAPKIVVIGAAYKPETVDCRESPAMHVVRLLRDDGYEVRHYDPLVPDMGYSSIADVAAGADLLLVLVGHRCVTEELRLHGEAIRQRLRGPILTPYDSHVPDRLGRPGPDTSGLAAPRTSTPVGRGQVISGGA